jgi:hypothetical protein
MSDIASNQDALITYEVIQWLSAHCAEHESFEASCLACQLVPQACPEHPQVNGSWPGFDLGCEACMATRPGSINLGVVDSEVVTAEEACFKLGLPFQAIGRGMIRVPLNLLRRRRR